MTIDRDFEDPFLRAAISSGGDMARVAARIAYRQMVALERQAAATEKLVKALELFEGELAKIANPPMSVEGWPRIESIKVGAQSSREPT